ncbi:MAG: DNA helicase PcrA [Clostridiales bacterium]|nr:DNA helicase PcrA [Clostridiales bacterium]
MEENRLIEGLNDRQKEAVLETEGPVLVIAGAGSGKTRVLTHRIAYLIEEKCVRPWNILAITFTNKAANEMKERTYNVVGDMANDIWIGTFHSICVRILRKYIDRLGYTSNFNIFDTTDCKTIIKECIKELNIDDRQFTEKSLLSNISNLKNDMVDEEQFETIAGSDFRQAKIAQVYKLYQKKLKQNNGIDFDDIILLTIKLLLENVDALTFYQQKFQYILVDEYQDTNKSQFTLINLLAGMYGNVFVVGDNDQSIYAFRGADITNILNFEKDYPGAKIIKLEQNYRSTQPILDVANEVIKNNESKIVKELWTENKEGEKPIYNNLNNEYDEAQYIAKCIDDKVMQGKEYNDFTILYRTNAQSRAIEDIFMRERVPYKVIGGQKFYDRKEIKDIIAYLRLIENNKDAVSLKRVINEPKRGIGQVTLNNIENIANIEEKTLFEIISKADEYSLKSFATLKDFAQMITDFAEEKDKISIEELTNRVLDVTGYIRMLENEKTVEAQGRIENLKEFLTVIIEFESENADNTLSDFLENLALITDLDNLNEGDNYVTMMTMHNAKGLEFDTVFVTGMEEGLFPSYRSLGEENGVEEERRLCYVAMTRAKKELYLLSARMRSIFGSTTCNMPSRFIKEIPEYMIQIIKKEVKPKQNEDRADVVRFEIKEKNPFNYRSAESFLSNLNNKVKETAANFVMNYEIGQNVSHRKFGKGIITNIEEEGDDYKVEINFESAGTKRLMAKFAGLEIIN